MGTFKDRLLLSEFPTPVFDGMTVAGYALGARHGLVYLRGEYSSLWDWLLLVLKTHRENRLLGAGICGRAGFDFGVRVQLGVGACIRGKESAFLDSLEGQRGAPRDRPAFPTERGSLQQPTAIDNVETCACAERIMAEGLAWFVDAATVGKAPYVVHDIAPATMIEFASHILRPDAVLAIERQCHGGAPKAFPLASLSHAFEFLEPRTQDTRRTRHAPIVTPIARIRIDQAPASPEIVSRTSVSATGAGQSR